MAISPHLHKRVSKSPWPEVQTFDFLLKEGNICHGFASIWEAARKLPKIVAQSCRSAGIPGHKGKFMVLGGSARSRRQFRKDLAYSTCDKSCRKGVFNYNELLVRKQMSNGLLPTQGSMSTQLAISSQLLVAAQAGDMEALGRLLQVYRGYLNSLPSPNFGVGCNLGWGRSDVVRDVFLSAHRSFRISRRI